MKIQQLILAFFTVCTFIVLIATIGLTIANPNKAGILGFMILISVAILSLQISLIIRKDRN